MECHVDILKEFLLAQSHAVVFQLIVLSLLSILAHLYSTDFVIPRVVVVALLNVLLVFSCSLN